MCVIKATGERAVLCVEETWRFLCCSTDPYWWGTCVQWRQWRKHFGPNTLLTLQCSSCSPQGAPLGTRLLPNSPSPQSLREQCLQQSQLNLSQKRGPQRLNILFSISKLSSFDDELEPKHSFSHSSSYMLFCACRVISLESATLHGDSFISSTGLISHVHSSSKPVWWLLWSAWKPLGFGRGKQSCPEFCLKFAEGTL